MSISFFYLEVVRLGDIPRYLFILRYPMIVSIFLIVTGIYGRKISLFRGLFVLQNRISLAAVVVTALLAARACVLNLLLLATKSPVLIESDMPTLSASTINIEGYLTYILTVLLALFIIVPTYYDSKKDRLHSELITQSKFELEVGLVFGAMIAVIFFVLGVNLFELFDTLFKQDDLILARSIQFSLVLFTSHILSGWMLNPLKTERPFKAIKSAPTLMYALLLFSWLVLVLGLLSLLFDSYRISPLLVIATVAVISYAITGNDYFFQLNKSSWSGDEKPEKLGETALRKRLELTKPNTLIIVCAAGGGIQAAAWTAKVLTGLEEELQSKFTDSLALMSCVSGGSVGSMFYLEGFDYLPKDRHRKSEKIFKAACEESLDATGWGLANADFWKFLGFGWLIVRNKLRDRGWAIEQNWKESFVSKKIEPLTLHKWRERIRSGELPVPIFNATLVESGIQLLLSPIPINFIAKGKDMQSTDLYRLYGKNGKTDVDMEITTAVRLSATFPYVSPVCRAYDQALTRRENEQDSSENVHIGDGGYFDNFGVFSALEWLRSHKLNLPQTYCELGIKKVLLLQIISFPENTDFLTLPKKRSNGWFTSLFGPIIAAAKVREGAQTIAAEEACKAFKREVGGNNFDHHRIFFPENPSHNYDPPLSWKLTQGEVQEINRGWEQIKDQEVNFIRSKIS